MKLAIVGTVEETAILANKLDDSWTIWTINGTWGYVNRTNRHFEIHGIDYLLGLPNIDKRYFKWMADKKELVTLKQSHDLFPFAQTLPLDAVLNKFPHRFLTSTPAIVLALALAEHEDELTDIAIFGIDMAAEDEYRDQRECFYWYMGYATGKGIDISLPPSCPLLTADHIYSYEQPSPVILHIKKLKDNAEREKRNAEAGKIEALKKEQFYAGVIETSKDLEKLLKR